MVVLLFELHHVIFPLGSAVTWCYIIQLDIY